MSFDWHLYVALASELLETAKTEGMEEAYFRSSISRSYYGVFCIARNKRVFKYTKKEMFIEK